MMRSKSKLLSIAGGLLSTPRNLAGGLVSTPRNLAGGLVSTPRNLAGSQQSITSTNLVVGVPGQFLKSQISPIPRLFVNTRYFSTSSDTNNLSTDSYPTIRYGRQTQNQFNWGFQIVPEGEAFVIERFGKYVKTLNAGFHSLIPFVDKIKFIHCLKEDPIPIPKQSFITSDNVRIRVGGYVFVKIVDPKLASYGAEDTTSSMIEVARSIMDIELKSLPVHETYQQSQIDALNEKIEKSINEAAKGWGLQCIRYRIGDISLPDGVKADMAMKAASMRAKRILRDDNHLECKGNAYATRIKAKGKNKANAVSKKPKRDSFEVARNAAERAFSKIMRK